MYIKKELKFKIIQNECMNEALWFLTIEIWNSNINGFYHGFYRSPSKKINNNDAIEMFDRFLYRSVKLKKNNIIVGDLNIDLNRDNLNTKKIENILIKHGLNQMIDFNTRVVNDSHTKIDVVLTNTTNEIKCRPLHNDEVSDHKTIMINIKITKNITNKIKQIWSWREYSKEMLINNLRNCKWAELQNNTEIEEKIKIMRHNLESSVAPMVKKIKINIKMKNKKWFDEEAKIAKIKKNDSYKIWNNNKTNENWIDYTKQRNEYNKIIKTKKNEMNQNRIRNAGKNQKKIWNCLKNITNDGKTKISDEIKFENMKSRDDKIICENFNKFFVNSIIKIDSEIPNVPNTKPNINVNNNVIFKFKKVACEEICEIAKILTKKINKSDLCNSMVWNDSMEYIGHFMSQIINQSLETGIIPEIWKTSHVIPIPKINNTQNASEFRPINTLPNDEKILEIIVKKQLIYYIEKNNLLSNYQSAFRNNFSCETALNYVISDWHKAIDKNEKVIIIALDLKRAFETINRNKLIEKMELYGIKGVELKWFHSYLNNRKQKTKFNEEISNAISVPIGLPQGTALSVILFLLYINDIVNIEIKGKISLFADDTLLVVKNKNIETAISDANSDLDKIYNWMNENKLMLNVSKTKWMIISKTKEKNHKCDLFIGNKIIERVECLKYLGILIDENLNFNQQIKACIKKASFGTNLLKRNAKSLTFHTKKMIYSAIIQSQFDYCSTLYINCNKTQINELQKIQNRALRIILNCVYLTPRKFMLDSLGWLSIQQRIKYNVLVMIYKIKNGMMPKYLSNYVTFVYQNHDRNLRSKNEIRTPNYKSEIAKKSIFDYGIRLYNEMPNNIKNSNSLTQFKNKCSEYIKQKMEII